VAGLSSPGTDAPAPKRKAKTKRKHTVGQVVLASTVVLALVTALSVVFFYRHLNGNLDVNDVTAALGDDRPEKVYKGNGEPLNILVMGDDTRSGEGNAIDKETGGGGSDTTILVHLSADRKRAYAVSIPRDSIVDRPDCGEDDEIPGGTNLMWNAAYAAGGAACTMRQLEANTGIFIDHYVVVDFNGFKDMVDAVGGVPVCIPEDIDDPAHNIFIKAGDPNMLEGNEALDYVRVRYYGAEKSDISRIKRQQNFIAALVNKVKSADTLTRLDKVVRFLDAATDSLEVDEGLGSVTRIGKIAMQLQSIGLDKVKFVTVPNAYYPRDSEFWGRVYWTDEADELWKKLSLDQPLTRELTSGSINAAQPPGAETPTPTPTETGSDTTESPTETPSETESPTETPSETESPTETATPSEEEAAQAEEALKAGLCA
jgi:LCP family protein required for cell wall assembly